VGVLGDYIGRIFLESKKRPIYITDETNIGKENEELAEDSETKRD